ncbi:hypothetical protein GGR06_001633 [Bacteroides reticulotermitis]|nr:hypothetical protein [Bacteroides reticulotermitis]MBB4043847.1 hypothetical protein [Bacteroides reticulotermitis]
MSIKEAIDAPAIQLSEWMRIDNEVTQSMIVSFISAMLQYFGRKEEDMNSFQVKKIVDDIISKYYYFRIEDVCLCFKMARTNIKTYGKFYGVIDGGTIMGWFAAYDKQRDEHIAAHQSDSPPTDYTNSVTREDYEEIALAMAAGGDARGANAYANIIETRKRFDGMRIDVGNYKYNRAHKFDEKYKKRKYGYNQ